MNKNKLIKIKSYLITLAAKESDDLRLSNINHLIYCLDELILEKNRISFDEILSNFKSYSEFIFELKICYYMLKNLKIDLV